MTRLTLILALLIFTSCKTANHTTTLKKINSGQNLDKVSLISFNDFFNQWVFNKRIQKIDLNIRELYSDSQFTYFGKPRLSLFRLKWAFFKVYTDTIAEQFPNYKTFYGDEMREFLWSEVIPKEEIDLWNYNRTTQQNQMKANCSYKKNRPVYNYSLIDKAIVLTMTWEIDCQELEKLRNKTYKVSYNLLTKQFEKN